MAQTAYCRADILKALYSAVKENVVKTVFVTDRPNALQEQLDEFAIVGTNEIVDDADTYQSTFATISVFHRNKSNGIEDTVRLEELQSKVVALFPMTNELFTAIKPRLVIGGDDGLEFHYLTIQVQVTINKSFIYK